MIRISLWLVAAMLGLASCGGQSSSGGGGGGGADGGGGASGSSCAAEESCGDAQSGCIACAEADACLAEADACKESMDCLAYGECLTGCVEGDEECQVDCANAFPVGYATYSRLLDCVICEQCPVACDAAAYGCHA